MFEFEFFVGIAGGVGIALIVWSLTELARITADHSGWHFNEKDELTKTAGGERIAFTIEDAAAAMQDLGWLIPGAVSWGSMPHDNDSRAAAVIATLDQHGRHNDVNLRSRQPLPWCRSRTVSTPSPSSGSTSAARTDVSVRGPEGSDGSQALGGGPCLHEDGIEAFGHDLDRPGAPGPAGGVLAPADGEPRPLVAVWVGDLAVDPTSAGCGCAGHRPIAQRRSPRGGGGTVVMRRG